MEKLSGGIGLSLVLLYLASWGIYHFSPRGASGDAAATGAYVTVSLVCVLLGILARKDIHALLRSFRVRRAVLGYAFLLLWTMVILAIIRNYSGLGWGADWLGHFQRSLFFLHRFTADTPLLGGAQLPSRPPMMNVLAAFFLAHTQDRFELFQVASAFFNLLLFLPCCLMLPALGLARRPRILPLVALFAFSPVVMENATYSWTKSLSAFFVVLAFWFYLAAQRKGGRLRMVAAFLALSAGLLVHYSAGPYCLLLGFDYLLRVFWKRPRKWRELAAIAVSCGLLLATWFAWSLAVYGPRVTIQSNTSVTDAREYRGNNLLKIGANLADSVVPYLLRRGLAFTDQPNHAGVLRDNAFAFYQVNLIFSMGLVGGPFVVWLLWGFVRRRAPAVPEWRFWRVLIPCAVVVGIGVVGERDHFGTAHLTLIPLEVLGLSLVAAAFPWRRVAALAIVAGCIVDFSLGVFLQARVEALENTPIRTVFTAGLSLARGTFQEGSPTRDGLSGVAWVNWFLKHRFALCRRYLDILAGQQPSDAEARELMSRAQARLRQDLKEGAVSWQGWWERHDYTLDFLGDDVADPSGGGAGVPQAVLVILFLALTGMLVREMRPRPPSRVPQRAARARDSRR
jgi:4-amino-4-deoxy-L-arabinose transferase-like glycosyltransferase